MNQIGLLVIAITTSVTALGIAHAANPSVLHEPRAETSAAARSADAVADFAAQTRGIGLG